MKKITFYLGSTEAFSKDLQSVKLPFQAVLLRPSLSKGVLPIRSLLPATLSPFHYISKLSTNMVSLVYTITLVDGKWGDFISEMRNTGPERED